jgi:tetratricopeptide (TPR) repeat protein
MAEKYDLALKIIELVLSEKPNHVEGIALKAEVYGHLEKYDIAIQLVENALSIQRHHIPALRVALDAYEGLRDWEKVIVTSDTILNMPDSADKWDRGVALRSKGNAHLEMGQNREAQEIVEVLGSGNTWYRRMAEQLRERLKEKLK